MSAAARPGDTVLVREEARPRWPAWRLGPASLDGLLRRRGDGRVRLLHVGDEPVVVAVAPAAGGRVALAARASGEAAAREGIARMRFAAGVDDDLAEFHDRFSGDRTIGRAVRSERGLRAMRRPLPWEALAWAVTEQLIDLERAVEIQKRLVAALGRRCARTRLRDAPSAAAVAAAAPARLVSLGLSAQRANTLRRAAIELATGRADPHTSEGLRRLRAISGIGRWTMECLALHGLGRLDVVPAGDLGYLKLVGRLATGNPRAIADEAEVRGFFARYAPYAGLAGEYLRFAAATGLLTGSDRVPARAGGHRSAGSSSSAAA